MALRISKGTGISALVAIAFVVVIGFFIHKSSDNIDSIGSSFDSQKAAQAIVSDDTGACGLTVFSPAPESTVSFPLSVKAVIDNSAAVSLGCSWGYTDTRGGSVEVLDADGNILGGGLLSLDKKEKDGTAILVSDVKLTTAAPSKNLNLIFTEENAGEDGSLDTFTMPVKTI